MKRSFLAFLLKLLSKWAIKKHKMKIIVVAGMHGTKITGELIAGMLQPDLVVRRQLEGSFWDFSIPLAILGIEDCRYTFWQWPAVLISATLLLLFGRSNPTWTILQMNTYKSEIASYWLEIFCPDITTFVNVEGKQRTLEKLLVEKTKERVIIPTQIENWQDIKEEFRQKILVVGKDQESDLTIKFVKELENGLVVTLQDQNNQLLEFFAFQNGHFMINPITASISTLIAMDFEYEEIREKLMRTEIELERFLHKDQQSDQP
jgi:hypothetical protein